MRLVLLGIPGAGKGTQGALLSDRYHIPAISTGAILREAVQQGSAIGELASRYINRGQLVPDEVISQLVASRLREDDCRQGFLLDGFPRTLPQARLLQRLLRKLGTELDVAVDIVVSPEVAVERIAGRLICRRCGRTFQLRDFPAHGPWFCPACGGELTRRSDDTVQTARERIAVYLIQTRPVAEYYQAQGILHSVNGELEIEQTFQQIVQKLDVLNDHFEECTGD
ncbi:MAG: adenylate kinase [Limnochordaceae bacterium]|nr:adenylate kinase [Limnochordaceae bacterium]